MKRLNTFYYLFSVHLSGVVFFPVFRLILYFYNYEQTAGIENKTALLLQALWKGLQFDNLIASYITCVPLLVLSILALFDRRPQWIIKVCNSFFMIAYSVAFMVCIVDIPYFSAFSAHIQTDALGWLQFGSETTGMIFQELRNYPFFALFLLAVFAFYRLLAFFSARFFPRGQSLDNTRLRGNDRRLYIPLTVLLWAVCFLGMRGSLQRYPLRVGFAYFSNHSFYNQLGVNPNFSFLKSVGDASGKRKNIKGLMPLDEAFSRVREALNVPTETGNRSVNRPVQPTGEAVHANVVVILLESMAADCLQAEYQGRKLTPFLNDLIARSYYFEHFYSAGIHTNNGIVSTLYGFPALFDRPSMESSPAHYTGLPGVLRAAGYRTFFFVTSNPQYDHMNSFLYANGFDRIYSQYDYPKEKVVNNFGVQDDYLLEYGLNRLNEAAQEEKPFLAAFLTVSKHTPFIVPERFKNVGADEEECILAFTDSSLKDFMDAAAKQDWFRNTFFIFLGDHGRIKGRQEYDMALDYNHIPCIIYSPLLKDAPRRFPKFGGQIDIFPTVMGLLNRPYVNNSFGIDLLRETRPCMFFVSNNRLGCIDDNYFYVRNLDVDADILYDLRNRHPENVMDAQPDTGGKLKDYAVSMIVAADYLMKENKKTKAPRRK
ncbi:MAG: sulfatase-like hydrolase/transferase [Dysgonamonadaceae bacterium]|jgi:phosphoglycerol transferase MdoB-like AlkP superfamily enzyme|nr:sulfatase-like hydrolase/transferase [Dysgonamonadaceae bacterium]